MNNIIWSDLYRHDGLTGWRGFIVGWFRKPGFRYTFLFRLVQQNRGSVFFYLFKLIKRRYRFKYGFEINLKAQIGEGFYLSDHCGSVIIGPIKIGKNCNIAHNVTLGRTYRNGVLGRPTVGDRVWIGTGAVVVGQITIGSNVLIAPNAYVNQDVPDNSLVIGNPAKIYSKENPTKYYINNILGEDEQG